MITTKLATLVELDTVLSVEDVYMLLEIAAVDAYNRRILIEKSNREAAMGM